MNTSFPLRIKLDVNSNTVVDREAHSWVKNHYKHLFVSGASVRLLTTEMSATSLVMFATSGALVKNNQHYHTHYLYRIDLASVAGINDDNFGIIVGSGNTAEDFDDYGLATKINNGAGAGQLEYAAMNNPGFSGNKTLTYTRAFTNNSGGSITIAEIGLVHETYYDGLFGNYVMMARDVLDSAITLNNGEVLTVNYIMSLGYPAN